ncbi:MAG TPA: NAD(P)/FAD-dependent oxidoreductase [Candidatus Baltobacteraceae bacterium]
MAATRVVVVGGGFAGVSTARALERASRKGTIDLTLVNRQNFMLFTPMLPEVAAGSIETRHIVQPLRAALRGTRGHEGSSRFELGEAIGVDVERRTVTVQHPLTHESKLIEYDELVLALGATDSTMGIPGVEKFTIPLKTIADAEVVRNRVVGALEVAAKTDDLLERDRLLRFVVVGGNFTGVELAGELNAFLHSILRYYPSIERSAVELVVLESSDKLLGHLPAKFGKYAASSLRERGTRLLLGTAVDAVDGHGVQLKSGERIASATVLWAAGEAPSPLAKTLGLKTDKHGAIETGGDFAVTGTPHVWALGDCAAVPRPGGGTYAPLAQNAIREGKLLASNILARARGKATRNFRYKEMGQMASLGDRQALAEIPGGHMIVGMPAWLAWRTYYLGRLPGWNRKARVALDWTLGLAFPPETARLPMVEKGETSFSDREETRASS